METQMANINQLPPSYHDPAMSTSNSANSNGLQRDEHTVNVPATNRLISVEGPPPAGTSLLFLAICATICCPLCGALAVYMAYEADMTFHRGNNREAKQKAKTSKYVSIGTITCSCLMVLGIIIYVVVVFAIGVKKASELSDWAEDQSWDELLGTTPDPRRLATSYWNQVVDSGY